MNSQEFDQLIKKDRYQVFVFTCPGSFPFIFARHPWFVVNKRGTISRWEVLFRKNLNNTSWGHLHKNFLPLFLGIEIVPFINVFHHKAKLLNIIEGDENSTARKIADFIENSKENYPYCDKYSLFGPNSDTYGQWILDNFPELKIKLPWNCFGKNFKPK